MTEAYPEIGELDLLAYVDGLLDPARRLLVEAHLRENPARAAQLAVEAQQNREIRAHYGAPCDAPERLLAVLRGAGAPARRRWLPPVMASAAAGALGVAAAAWWIGAPAPDDAPLRFAQEIESLTFQVRNGEAEGEWEESPALREISRELASDFDSKGFVQDDFHIVGSQQLWRKGQEVLQFRFRDAGDRKYTVFVTTRRQNPPPGYRLAEEDGRRIAYWADGPAVFAVTTQAEAEKLMQLVQAIDRSVCTEDQFSADWSH